MRKLPSVKIFAAVALTMAISFSGAVGASALQSAAAKTITCYKGTQVKKVTTAKCPSGWSTKKPAATTAKSEAFKANYAGTGTVTWSASDVQATAISGTDAKASLGLTTMTASGSSNPESQCASIRGDITLKGKDGNLVLKVDSSSQACGADDQAPTTVKVTAKATVASGTGKFAGATGTLTITGSFAVKSTDAGFKEAPKFSAAFSGTLKLK